MLRAFDAFGARLVDASGAGGVEADALGGDEAIGRNIDPAVEMFAHDSFGAEGGFDGGGHWTGGFAGGDSGDRFDLLQVDRVIADEKPVAIDLHVLGDEAVGLHGGDTCAPDAFDVGAELFGRTWHGRELVRTLPRRV